MLSKLRALHAQFGSVQSSLYIIDRLFQRLGGNRASLTRHHLMAQNARIEPVLPRGRDNPIVVREATFDDVELQDWACGRDIARARLTAGIVGLLAFQESSLVGYVWISLGSYRDELLPLEFVPSPAGVSAWSLDVFVHPNHRLSFAFATLCEAVFVLMQERRLAWMMSAISPMNRLSLSSHKRLGSVCVGNVVAMVIGRFVAVLQLPGPRFAVAWGRRLRVVVRAPIAAMSTSSSR